MPDVLMQNLHNVDVLVEGPCMVVVFQGTEE
jgi:hypothetical protein